MPEDVVQAKEDPVPALIEVVQTLVGKLDSLEAKCEALQVQADHLTKVVDDEIIGGIQNLYQEQTRFDGISGLKKSYPDFGPYGDQFSKLAGKDIYEALYDVLEAMKKEEGFTAEAGDARVKSILSEVQGTLKLPEPAKPPEEPKPEPKEEPKEPPKEEKKPEPEKEPESEIDKTIKDMKAKKAPGMRRAVQGD